MDGECLLGDDTRGRSKEAELGAGGQRVGTRSAAGVVAAFPFPKRGIKRFWSPGRRAIRTVPCSALFETARNMAWPLWRDSHGRNLDVLQHLPLIASEVLISGSCARIPRVAPW